MPHNPLAGLLISVSLFAIGEAAFSSFVSWWFSFPRKTDASQNGRRNTDNLTTLNELAKTICFLFFSCTCGWNALLFERPVVKCDVCLESIVSDWIHGKCELWVLHGKSLRLLLPSTIGQWKMEGKKKGTSHPSCNPASTGRGFCPSHLRRMLTQLTFYIYKIYRYCMQRPSTREKKRRRKYHLLFIFFSRLASSYVCTWNDRCQREVAGHYFIHYYITPKKVVSTSRMTFLLSSWLNRPICPSRSSFFGGQSSVSSCQKETRFPSINTGRMTADGAGSANWSCPWKYALSLYGGRDESVRCACRMKEWTFLIVFHIPDVERREPKLMRASEPQGGHRGGRPDVLLHLLHGQPFPLRVNPKGGEIMR